MIGHCGVKVVGIPIGAGCIGVPATEHVAGSRGSRGLGNLGAMGHTLPCGSGAVAVCVEVHSVVIDIPFGIQIQVIVHRGIKIVCFGAGCIGIPAAEGVAVSRRIGGFCRLVPAGQSLVRDSAAVILHVEVYSNARQSPCGIEGHGAVFPMVICQIMGGDCLTQLEDFLAVIFHSPAVLCGRIGSVDRSRQCDRSFYIADRSGSGNSSGECPAGSCVVSKLKRAADDYKVAKRTILNRLSNGDKLFVHRYSGQRKLFVGLLDNNCAVTCLRIRDISRILRCPVDHKRLALAQIKGH